MAEGKNYNVAQYLDDAYLQDPDNPVTIPPWFTHFMELLNKDERLQAYPVKAIAHFGYDALMEDAMHYAFTRIETQGGVEIGTLAERSLYIQNILEAIRSNVLDFDKLYMPLVLGGITVCDLVQEKNEKPSETVQALRQMLDARHKEKVAANAATFELASQLIEQVSNRYTMNLW